MKFWKLLATLSFTFVFLLGAAQNASAVILLSDNFDDNSLNASLWTTSLPGGGSSSITEQNQRIEMVKGPFLNTVSEFKPSDYNTGIYTGGINVAGRWQFNTSNDSMVIVTRGDGLASGTDPKNGIVFLTEPTGYIIYRVINGAYTILKNGAIVPSSSTPTFNFSITDDGTNLSFSLTDLGNSSTNTFTTTSNQVYTTNKVMFLNRFSGATSSYLDNVVIQANAIPEPSSIISFVLGSIGLVICSRRNRNR